MLQGWLSTGSGVWGPGLDGSIAPRFEGFLIWAFTVSSLFGLGLKYGPLF